MEDYSLRGEAQDNQASGKSARKHTAARIEATQSYKGEKALDTSPEMN